MEQMKRTFKHRSTETEQDRDDAAREGQHPSRLQTGCTSPIRPSGASCAATGCGMSIR